MPSSRPLRIARILVVVLLAGCGSSSDDPGAGPTEILWDEWGIPHIYAASPPDLMYAFGWAQMHSHGNLLLKLYVEARGRSAEIYGEEALASDRWVHTMGVPERAALWWNEQGNEEKALLEGFAAGINAYIARHPESIDPQLVDVAPITGVDLLAHAQRVVHFTFVADERMTAERPGGSNTWAIGPSRSASGETLLLINPHLPWDGRFLFYEAHLVLPDLNAYGSTLVGVPALALAFNENLGWSHTVNTIDGADLYRLTEQDGGYLIDGERREYTVREVDLTVADGEQTRQERLVIRESVHGPVVREIEGNPIALRVAGLDRPHMVRQWWAMTRAANLEEFTSALRQLQVPMFTVMYADREGHILHLFGGTAPKRTAGDWTGVVAGDRSDNIWQEYHAYEELPQLLDPASGWLQNANDPPWTTTFPEGIDPAAFPTGIAPSFMHFRAQRSARLLLADNTFTLDKLIAAKHSTRMEMADRLLDDLLPSARSHSSDLVRAAAAVLTAWDRRADAMSRGGPLFAAWAGRIARESPYRTPWNPDEPLETPDGLASEELSVAALAAAATELNETFGRLDLEWGEVYRLRRDDIDLPASGGPGGLGIFRVLNFRPDSDGRQRAVMGDSFVAAVHFSDPVEARALTVYGNSTQPGSAHRTDQLELFSEQRLRPVWLNRADVEAHTKDRIVF